MAYKITEYKKSCAYLKELKTTEKKINGYWDEPIANANKAHKDLIAKKKEMLAPILEEENKIKKEISDYIISQENAKELLENTKNEYGVEIALPNNVEKVDGISYTDNYVIESIDPETLPRKLNGVELVKVDKSAIKKLIKATNGKIEIPGVTYSKSKTIRVKGE